MGKEAPPRDIGPPAGDAALPGVRGFIDIPWQERKRVRKLSETANLAQKTSANSVRYKSRNHGISGETRKIIMLRKNQDRCGVRRAGNQTCEDNSVSRESIPTGEGGLSSSVEEAWR